MGNQISELASYMQPLAEKLIANCEAAGIPVVVIDTGRTPEEQVQKRAEGVSWTTYSRHEPQPPEGKSEAIDICPKVLLGTKLWSPGSDLWNQIGHIGKLLGLEWGGDWVNCPADPSHFQYIRPLSNT